ncbi:MAG: leucine-rich repeat domain-containing protein [Candidatus Cryptobacteroides sp.]
MKNTHSKTFSARCAQAFIYSIIAVFMMFSCSDENELSYEENSRIAGSKWVLSNWDYSIGDDYIGIHNESFTFFFYSQTEGALRCVRKDEYSDQGTDTWDVACHFTYIVKEDYIQLEHITDWYFPTIILDMKDNILKAKNLEFSRESITYDDYRWLNTVHGSTGQCYWYSDMLGKLWIVGDGAMEDYSSYSKTPWAANNRTPNNVVVCDGVTSIGAYAFANVSIVEVDMPDNSLKNVGAGAFKGSLIKTIWMSQSTTEIGEEAFAGCKSLKQVHIPDNIETIGGYAFSGCTSLNMFRFEFGENLKSIGEFAFEGVEASFLTFSDMSFQTNCTNNC